MPILTPLPTHPSPSFSQGKVENPSGDGIPIKSSQVPAKSLKVSSISGGGDGQPGGGRTKSRGDSMGSKDDDLSVGSGRSGDSAPSAAGGKGPSVKGGKGASKVGTTTAGVPMKVKRQGGGAGRSKGGQWTATNLKNAERVLGGGSGGWDLDPNDPLYDEEEEIEGYGRYILVSEGARKATGKEGSDDYGARDEGSPPRNQYDPLLRATVAGPMLTLSEFKRRLTPAIDEYFDSGSVPELLRCVEEMKCPEFHYEVVKRAISQSLDRGDAERELVSRLIATGYPSLFTTNQIGKAFERLFEVREDLALDVPGADARLTAFLARAVIDEVLPPAFLTDSFVRSLGGGVVDGAVLLLSREHSAVRLEKIWGPGAERPVGELKALMDQLLREFVMSRDLDEAKRCLVELNCSPFHHELVKRSVRVCGEEGGGDENGREVGDMCSLINFLWKNEVVSSRAFAKGIDRCWEVVDDLRCDVPNIEKIINKFEEMGVEAEIIEKQAE